MLTAIIAVKKAALSEHNVFLSLTINSDFFSKKTKSTSFSPIFFKLLL